MQIALTRPLSPRIVECELTHLERRPIDIERATRQHRAYAAALARLGCEVRELPPEPELPDGVFVEDTAVVLDEIAIIARSAAVSRRAETASVEATLSTLRPIVRIEDPATLDGGDVFRLGRDVFVGASSRSNAAAVAQMHEHLAPLGFAVHAVPVTGCLHLKTACTVVAQSTSGTTAPGAVVINRAWCDPAAIRKAAPNVRLVDVHPDEPHGANHLLIGNAVISPASCPRTVERIRALGIDVEIVDVSELEKAESGVTCSSLIIDMRA